MKRHLTFLILAAGAIGLTAGASRTAFSGASGQTAGLVRLQTTFPGTVQTGNANIEGFFRAGRISLDGPGSNLAIHSTAGGGNSIYAVNDSPNYPAVLGFVGSSGNAGVWGRNTTSGAEALLGYGTSGIAADDGGTATNNAGIFYGKVAVTGANGGLTVDASMGAGSAFDGGIVFQHSNHTQGIGFGYNTIYASGSNADQSIGLMSKGGGAIELSAITGFVHAYGKTYVDTGFGGNPGITLAVGDTDTGLDWQGDGNLDFCSNTIHAMSVRGANVGIGTGSPEAQLHLTGNMLFNNAQTLLAKNASGGIETWMWPRWTDNAMYTNYGASGWHIRTVAGADAALFANNKNATFNGNVFVPYLQSSGGILAATYISAGGSSNPNLSYIEVAPGNNNALQVYNSNNTNYPAFYAQNRGGGTAGYFAGNLGASSKSFVIDHPLDPANKYLEHSCVESDERRNLYDGTVTLDANGEATVTMPDWFEALNRDFRYQLTAIGGPGRDLYIAQEIKDDHFRIAGGSGGLKVSWQVTGVRHDAYSEAHPMQVERDKGSDRGRYIWPELFGMPKEMGGAMQAKRPVDPASSSSGKKG